MLVTGVIGGVAGFTRVERRLVERGNRVVIVDPYRLSLDSADVSFDALARRIEAVLDARGVASARVVGHAHGGGVALRLAARAPRRVTALYLVNVGALDGNRSPMFSSAMRFAPLITRLPGGRGFVRRRILNGIRENSGSRDWIDEETARAYADPLLDHIGRVVDMAQRLGESEEPEPLAAVVTRVRAPVTLILGALSCPASPTPAELAALAPLGALVQIHRVPGSCHFPHEEAPEMVVRILTAARTVGVRPRPDAAVRFASSENTPDGVADRLLDALGGAAAPERFQLDLVGEREVGEELALHLARRLAAEHQEHRLLVQ